MITSLLDAFDRLQYPAHLVNIWISDDFSEDDTAQLVRRWAPDCRFPVHLIEAGQGDQPGKKAALDRAIRLSEGELIMTTDADCHVPPGWIHSVVNCYISNEAQMVTGMVRIAPYSGFFEKIQGLEFLSLSGSGAVSVIRKKPMMCNGANLAFTREAFLKAGGYDYGGQTASGDDTFLMLKIHRQIPGSVHFMKDKNGIVTTAPLISAGALFRQRMRWISKTRHYKEKHIRLIGLFLAAAHLIPLFSLLLAIAGYCPWWFPLLVWTVKGFPEWLFLMNITGFTGDRKLLCLFLPAIILYPFYTITGMASAVVSGSYEWKGRTYRI
jgi:cellulose synthase/poly-beta-1,6-N-acetylglucosamine synthase-like glycosyltransferase